MLKLIIIRILVSVTSFFFISLIIAQVAKADVYMPSIGIPYEEGFTDTGGTGYTYSSWVIWEDDGFRNDPTTLPYVDDHINFCMFADEGYPYVDGIYWIYGLTWYAPDYARFDCDFHRLFDESEQVWIDPPWGSNTGAEARVKYDDKDTVIINNNGVFIENGESNTYNSNYNFDSHTENTLAVPANYTEDLPFEFDLTKDDYLEYWHSDGVITRIESISHCIFENTPLTGEVEFFCNDGFSIYRRILVGTAYEYVKISDDINVPELQKLYIFDGVEPCKNLIQSSYDLIRSNGTVLCESTTGNIIKDLIEDNRPPKSNYLSEDWGTFNFLRGPFQDAIDLLYYFIDFGLDSIELFLTFFWPDSNTFQFFFDDIKNTVIYVLNSNGVPELWNTVSDSKPPTTTITMYGNQITLMEFEDLEYYFPDFRTYTGLAFSVAMMFYLYRTVYWILGSTGSMISGLGNHIDNSKTIDTGHDTLW